jgi:glycosyltransferase involved in cell wall biosynthesis
MRLLYLANIRLPTERAHGLQIMEMASALARGGDDVVLVVPKRKNSITEDPFGYYGIPRDFTIVRLPCVDLVRFGRVGYLVQIWTFSLFAIVYALRSGRVVYSRDEFTLFLYSFFGKPFVFEAHTGKWNQVLRVVMRRARLVVPITDGLKRFFVKKGVLESKMLVAPDGANLERFARAGGKLESRAALSLPENARIVVYSGHLYPRKGAHVLAESAEALRDTLVVFVGGTDEDVVSFRARYGHRSNILILGHRPHAEIPLYLASADVLVIPNSAKDDDSREFTSPMKLFEYMTSGTPIVASDVPSLREILTEETAMFFSPDDPNDLGRAVNAVLADDTSSARLGEKARTEVAKYDWNARAARIVAELIVRIDR